ncbi:hypothetical protein ACF1CG_36985 [Streptomyces sp. NPDC014773]|uniref:hypothetical protein n=1 Tax=Streptomyces sp. NPDC014773 TaxID=3364908 RepID=UPI0037029378
MTRRKSRTAAPVPVGSPGQTTAPGIPDSLSVGDQVAAAANAAAATAGGGTAALRALADGPQRIIPAQFTGTDAERLAQLEDALDGAATRAGRAIDLMKGWLDEQRGTVLREIHAHDLYKVKAKSFEQYVWDRWKLKRARAYQLMDAAPVLALMSAIADTPPVVSTATALVPVLKTHGADAVRGVLEQAHATAKDTGTKLTTAAIKRAVRDSGLAATPAAVDPATVEQARREEAGRKLTAAADTAERALALYEEALAADIAPADIIRAAVDLSRLTKVGRVLGKQTRVPGTPPTA